jgi:Mrp family chromosome partitioning ATPase
VSGAPAQHRELDAVYRAAFGGDLRVIAVTAPERGQGTSTLALALAERAAASGRSTLLVELTTRVSAVAERLGVVRRDWDERPDCAAAAIVPLAERLAVLPAPSLGRPAPLLREAAGLRLLRADWLARFDFVILDLAPVLSTDRDDIDAAMAAGVADGAILSLMTRVATETALIRSVDLLRRADVELLGVVANDRDNPTLGDEIAREIGRLRRLAPRPVARLQRWVRGRRLLQRRL